MRTPVVSGFLESFVSGSVRSSRTECPTGYTMYMYNGSAYCCKGRVNGDASKLERTCVAAATEKHTLCSLGPSEGAIPNCAGIQNAVMKELGKKFCPPSMPNFYRDGEMDKGRCCGSAVNEEGTACMDPRSSCSIGEQENEFRDPHGCRFLRMMESDTTCPAGYDKVIHDVRNTQSPLFGMAIYACTNLSVNCYTKPVIQRLRTLGYDTSQLKKC